MLLDESLSVQLDSDVHTQSRRIHPQNLGASSTLKQQHRPKYPESQCRRYVSYLHIHLNFVGLTWYSSPSISRHLDPDTFELRLPTISGNLTHRCPIFDVNPPAHLGDELGNYSWALLSLFSSYPRVGFDIRTIWCHGVAADVIWAVAHVSIYLWAASQFSPQCITLVT